MAMGKRESSERGVPHCDDRSRGRGTLRDRGETTVVRTTGGPRREEKTEEGPQGERTTTSDEDIEVYGKRYVGIGV